jgi:hypothetical protein
MRYKGPDGWTEADTHAANATAAASAGMSS